MEQKEYIAELEEGVWIAPWDGDPGRTLVRYDAKVFYKKSKAWEGIEKAQTMRPFKNAKVTEYMDKETKSTDE